MKRLIEVLKLAEKYLQERGVESPRLNAEHLLAKILALDRLGLYLAFDRPLMESELEAYRQLLRRRGEREPLQYILGGTGFRALKVELGPGVLIPRPETEGLVQLVLDRLGKVAENTATAGKRSLNVLDLCTGSGVVGLSLAGERECLWCLCADISPQALVWAKRNHLKPGSRWLSRAVFLCADLGEALARRPVFDVVAANPPYVAPGELGALAREIVRYEPLEALRGGGPDGTAIIERIVGTGYRIMRPGALLALEIGESQTEALRKIFQAYGAEYTELEFHCDLAGKYRYLTAFRSLSGTC